MDYFIIFIFLFLLMPLAAFFILKPMFGDMKIRNNVNNCDLYMCRYAYALSCTPNEAVYRLSAVNVKDAMDYSFDPNTQTISFTQNFVSIKYQLSFYMIDNKTYLLVSKEKKTSWSKQHPVSGEPLFYRKTGRNAHRL